MTDDLQKETIIPGDAFDHLSFILTEYQDTTVDHCVTIQFDDHFPNKRNKVSKCIGNKKYYPNLY